MQTYGCRDICMDMYCCHYLGSLYEHLRKNIDTSRFVMPNFNFFLFKLTHRLLITELLTKQNLI